MDWWSEEPIVTLDEARRRLVWTVEGIPATHYNASVQVDADGSGSQIVWTADFLPDEISNQIEEAMEADAIAMRAALTG